MYTGAYTSTKVPSGDYSGGAPTTILKLFHIDRCIETVDSASGEIPDSSGTLDFGEYNRVS